MCVCLWKMSSIIRIFLGVKIAIVTSDDRTLTYISCNVGERFFSMLLFIRPFRASDVNTVYSSLEHNMWKKLHPQLVSVMKMS